MSKSLKYQVVKLAKEKPQFRGFLLPLVDGKTATEESLRLALTKLAHQNSELRADLVPMIKEAGILEKLFKRHKKKHPNSEKPPQSLIDKANEMEKAQKEKKEEEKSESKSESEPEKPEGVADRERPDITNPSEMSDEDLSTALKSLKDDRGDLNGELIQFIHEYQGYIDPADIEEYEEQVRAQLDKFDKALSVLNEEQGNRDQAKAEKAKAEQEKAEKEKAKEIAEAKKKKEEAEKKEKERRDGLSDEERKKEDEENEKKLKQQQEEYDAMMDYYMYGYSRSASLRYQVVKLAKENPSLRGYLLPLVTGKTANNESLRLSLTKLAYANPSLRSAILPLVKTSGNDKVKVLNEKGREVWVKKETLKGPNKSKYKPIKEEKKEEKSRSKDEIQEELDDSKEYLQEANDEYDEAEQDFNDFVSAVELEIQEAGLDIDPLDGHGPDEAMDAIQDWIDSQDELPDDVESILKELDGYKNTLDRAGDSLEKAQEDYDKLEEELKQAESKKEKKQQGGGGKKKEKPAEETSEKSEKSDKKPQSLADKKKAIKDSIDKNTKLSQKEKDAQKKALEKMNEGDIDKKLKAMSDDEEEESGGKGKGKPEQLSLFANLVRLAHSKPELRKHILPLLK